MRLSEPLRTIPPQRRQRNRKDRPLHRNGRALLSDQRDRLTALLVAERRCPENRRPDQSGRKHVLSPDTIGRRNTMKARKGPLLALTSAVHLDEGSVASREQQDVAVARLCALMLAPPIAGRSSLNSAIRTAGRSQLGARPKGRGDFSPAAPRHDDSLSLAKAAGASTLERRAIRLSNSTRCRSGVERSPFLTGRL